MERMERMERMMEMERMERSVYCSQSWLKRQLGLKRRCDDPPMAVIKNAIEVLVINSYILHTP
jgi:hypothetical protein